MTHPAPSLQLALSQTFRADQVKVGDAAGKYAVAVWGHGFQIGEARASWARIRPTLMKIADQFYTADTAAGQRYYNASRLVYGLKPWNGAVGPVRLRADHAGKVLDSTGLGWFLHMVAGGSQMVDAYNSAQTMLSKAMGDLVMQGARDWITEASKADPASDGWTRITAGTCDFCESLAAQGVDVGEFEAHNNCMCTPEPSFTASQSDTTDTSASPDDTSSEPEPGVSPSDLMDLLRSLGSSAATDAAESTVGDAVSSADDVVANLPDSQALRMLRQWVAVGSIKVGGKHVNN